MCELIHKQMPIARKVYGCMACEWILNDPGAIVAEMTVAEKRAFVKAKRNGFKIQPGQQYVKLTMKEDGLYTFRALPEIHKICLRLDIYEC